MTQPDPQHPVPPDLPLDAARFYAARQDLPPSSPPPPQVSALERLGPSPFPRSRFPFLGFLASIYDHIAASMKE